MQCGGYSQVPGLAVLLLLRRVNVQLQKAGGTGIRVDLAIKMQTTKQAVELKCLLSRDGLQGGLTADILPGDSGRELLAKATTTISANGRIFSSSGDSISHIIYIEDCPQL